MVTAQLLQLPGRPTRRRIAVTPSCDSHGADGCVSRETPRGRYGYAIGKGSAKLSSKTRHQIQCARRMHRLSRHHDGRSCLTLRTDAGTALTAHGVAAIWAFVSLLPWSCYWQGEFAGVELGLSPPLQCDMVAYLLT